jgi:mannose-6-phosphate isomerase-like protein (cupin superfamily)
MAAMTIDPLPTRDLADAPTVLAPDGSTVRVLLAGSRGSMARFELEPGRTSTAVRHRTVEELWYVLSGRGEMWRRGGTNEAITALRPGTSLVIPVGTSFQFRSEDGEPLIVLGVTMPPWPGPDEAEHVDGCPDWPPSP